MAVVDIVVIGPALAREAVTEDRLARATGLRLGDEGARVVALVEETEALRRMTGGDPAWGGYLGVDAATREVVGCCSFDGAPHEGAVEIGYLTFPRFEGRGVATAMARALVALAFADARVHVVRARTLPAPSASTALLARLGFARGPDVFDPDEDGPVWTWRLAREAAP